MTDRHIVRFEGEGSGVGELSWGQREIWDVIRAKGDSLSIGGVRTLPSGLTVGDVADGLRLIMSRHQALRTRLRFDLDGQTRQVVHASGEIALEVVDAGDGDPAEVAAAVAAGYKARNFDYEHEWPLRMAVVTQRGAATHVAEMFCHLAVDAFGLAAVHDDLAGGTGPDLGPATGLPPLDQARRQQAPRGRLVHETAMRYFERLAERVPLGQFRGSADPRRPRFWQLTCESPAGYRAARVLAGRAGVTTSPVLLGAYAVAVTEFTSSEPAVIQLVVNNRFRPGFGGSVSTVTQSCPGVIDVAGASFGEVVVRAWHASLGAYKHAYYDPVGKDELSRRLAAERGGELDLPVFFNDRRVRSRELADAVLDDAVLDDAVPAAAVPAAAVPAVAPAELTMTWGERNDMPEQKLFLYINDISDTLCYELWADTHFVSPADMVAVMRRIESVLVESASGDVAGGAVAATGHVR